MNVTGGLRNAANAPLAKYKGIEIWWERLEDGSWIVHIGPSDSFRDFLRSLQLWSIGGYHAGYLRPAGGVCRALPGDLKHPGTKVTLVGHSLGGAIALHVADKLERTHQCEIEQVVTLGQPKIARHGMCQFKFPVTRYVCGDDWGSKWFPWFYSHQQPPAPVKSPNRKSWKSGLYDHRLTSYEDGFKLIEEHS